MLFSESSPTLSVLHVCMKVVCLKMSSLLRSTNNNAILNCGAESRFSSELGLHHSVELSLRQLVTLAGTTSPLLALRYIATCAALSQHSIL